MSPFVKHSGKLPKIGGEEGFTLIEVLISSIILAIALMAIAAAEVTAVGTNRRSNDISQATALADEILERMRRNQTNLTSYNGLNTSSTSFGSGIVLTDFNQWKTRMIAGGTGQVTVASGSPVTGVSLVTVTITWTDVLARTITVQTTF